MKRLWLCVACSLVLTSCVPVDDFGKYWDKGVVDPALEGSWQKLGCAGESPDGTSGRDGWRFTKNGANYSLQATNDEEITSARTLRVGRQLLLMQRDAVSPKDGLLTRYEVHGRTLNAYVLDHAAAADFLEQRHPNAANIRINKDDGRYVVIGTFDDEVFRILSEFVNDPAYWILMCQYRKTSK